MHLMIETAHVKDGTDPLGLITRPLDGIYNDCVLPAALEAYREMWVTWWKSVCPDERTSAQQSQ